MLKRKKDLSKYLGNFREIIKDIDSLSHKDLLEIFKNNTAKKAMSYEATINFLEKWIRIKHEEKLSRSTNRMARATWFLAIATILGSIFIGFIVPYQNKERETQNEITFLYRSIIANEEVNLANENNKNNFREFATIATLPNPYMEYNIDSNLHYLLQKKLGIINYGFLLYYLDQTRFLNKTREQLISSLISYGVDSDQFKNQKSIYLEIMDYLSREKIETKLNYFEDTECLLFILQNSFPYISVDKRDEKIDCSKDSLHRIFYHFGFIPADTPSWLMPRIEALRREIIKN